MKCTVPRYPVAVLWKASSAVTVAVCPTPAVPLLSPVTCSVAAAAGLIVTVWLPVMLLVTVSVAVTLCEPVVFSVTAKAWLPASPPTKV